LCQLEWRGLRKAAEGKWQVASRRLRRRRPVRAVGFESLGIRAAGGRRQHHDSSGDGGERHPLRRLAAEHRRQLDPKRAASPIGEASPSPGQWCRARPPARSDPSLSVVATEGELVGTGEPIPVATNTPSPRRSMATVDIIVSDPRQRGGHRVEWARSVNRPVPTVIPTTRRNARSPADAAGQRACSGGMG
jgi:hypothetical protein